MPTTTAITMKPHSSPAAPVSIWKKYEDCGSGLVEITVPPLWSSASFPGCSR